MTNAKDGTADPTQESDEFGYSVAVSSPVGSTAVFSIDQTVTVSLSSVSTVNGTYTVTCTVTDASPSCVNDVNSLTVDCVMDVILGTPPVDRILCYGPTNVMNTLVTECGPSLGAGEPLEVFFGASRFVNSGIVGTAGPVIGSGTPALLTTIDTSVVRPSSGIGLKSNNSITLQYSLVLEEGICGRSHT